MTFETKHAALQFATFRGPRYRRSVHAVKTFRWAPDGASKVPCWVLVRNEACHAL
jgi:hypothetical protein